MTTGVEIVKGENLEFRVFKNGGKIKSMICCDGYFECTLLEALDFAKNSDDFWFNDVSNKSDITNERLVRGIRLKELIRKDGDIDLLSRVIRNGGFMEYIKKLESNYKKEL